jgi:hypothetical protein
MLVISPSAAGPSAHAGKGATGYRPRPTGYPIDGRNWSSVSRGAASLFVVVNTEECTREGAGPPQNEGIPTFTIVTATFTPGRTEVAINASR